MSKSKQGGDDSSNNSSKSQVKQVFVTKTTKQGKLTIKQSEQIVAPPIKTKPKNK